MKLCGYDRVEYSVHPFSITAAAALGVTGGAGFYPSGYTLDKSPGYRRAARRGKEQFRVTLTPMVNF